MADVTRVASRKAAAQANGQRGGQPKADLDAVVRSLHLSDQDLLHTYRQMLEVRHFEELCGRAFRTGKPVSIGGYLHLYIGQEAVALGVLHTCKQSDQVLSSYRDHAHCLILGSDPGRLMAEIGGRATGVSRGKGGSMHLFDREHGFAGGYGIVGGNIPLSVGIGWALKRKKTSNICVCFLGDGAMNSGAFHESLNMAALYSLPILYVLENNHYAMGTSVERSHANTDLASRADSYCIAHSKVDGQDYFAVRQASQKIVNKMRRDPSPYFLEAITYRYVGHGAADDVKTQMTYRTPDEVEEWRRRDPVNILGDALRSRGLLDDDSARRMDEDAAEFARRAGEFAAQSPDCAPEELTQDVYAA